MKGRVSEKALQAQIAQTLRLCGARVYTIGRPPRRDAAHKGTGQTPGLPDLLAHMPAAPLTAGRCPDELIRPHALWIEVKAAGGRLSDAQQAFREFCYLADLPYVVGGLDAVLAYLVARGYLAPNHVAHYRRTEAATDGAASR